MNRVLIVDDNEDSLLYLQGLLWASGQEVDTARHGAEALVKARRSPPDLVVSDLLMLVMDGYTLLQHWKADPLLRSIKFAVYTASCTEAEHERLAMSLGADVFILKPADPQEFLSRIAQIQSSAAPPATPSGARLGHDDALMQSCSDTLIRKLEEENLWLRQSNRALLQDIAGRQETEAQQRLLNFAVLQSTEAVLITDAELDAPGPRIVFTNPAFTRLTGYDLSEVSGKTPRILQGPRTDPAVLRRLRAELERGSTFSGGSVNYRKDGSEYEQEWEVAPILDAQGRTTNYVAVLRDVTERNRAAQALLDSNLEQQQLADQLGQQRQRLLAAQRVAKIGSWEIDLATRDLSWSDETHRIHETQPSHYQPTYAAYLQLAHPDDRQSVDQAFVDSIERGDGGVIEHRVLLPDGRIKHVEEHWEVELDAKQNPVRALGTCQDVSERKEAESVLRVTSERLALATQSAQIGIWDWDLVENTLVWDAQMLRLYGLDDSTFGKVYEAWTQRLHPDDRGRVQSEISCALAFLREYRTQFQIVLPDGQLRDIEANGVVQHAADGTAIRMIGANRDISEKMQAERRIRYLNRVHAMMSSVNALIVRAGTRDELFQQACRIAVEAGGFHVAILGMVVPGGLDYVAMAGASEDSMRVFRQLLAKRDPTPSPMAARALQDRIACVSNASQSDPQAAYPEMQARFGIQSIAIIPLLVDGAPVGVLSLSAAEGDFFHAEEIALLTELAGDIALAVDHLDNRDRLAFLAYYDALTGLANRSLFLERVGQYARSASEGGQLAVLIFDLERFRYINESMGRDAGDQLLSQVAAWLTGHLGDANLLARIDADHFGLVIPASGGSGDLAHMIEHMMASFLGHSFEVNGDVLRIAARAGIAIYPPDGQDAETLFRRAEAALKKASTDGARYLFYAQKMTDAVAGRLALESQLRHALENEEFVLHYQPKVDLHSGLLSGAEALIRWNHPSAGLMPPALFIPILEDTGMIHDVGRWAVHQAISDWLRWRLEGLPAVPIAVNVSPMQLRDPAFISQLQQAIGIAEGAADGLELEITESMIMDDVKQSIASLDAIRAMGIRVAIDDFGTGFSSLGYLGKLPIDTLKIDRTFIVDMGASADGLSVVSTLMTLAHALKLKVVAEGVETPEQASQLGLLECDEIQGYLVSPPLACADFEARFLSTTWRMH